MTERDAPAGPPTPAQAALLDFLLGVDRPGLWTTTQRDELLHYPGQQILYAILVASDFHLVRRIFIRFEPDAKTS